MTAPPIVPGPPGPAPADPGPAAPGPRAPKPLAHRIRRWIVVVMVASFAIAAVAGIAVLLGGATSEPASKVLGTTALTGVFSVAVLCGAALIGRPVQWFGWITVAVSAATLARMLWMIWVEPGWDEDPFKLTITMVILTGACAIASLLLLLVSHDRRSVRAALLTTLALLALGVLLTMLLIWEVAGDEDDVYLQATGIVWILAALGIVVLPVMSLLLRTPPPSRPVASDTGVQGPADATGLSRASLERIAAAARAEGVTPDELVERLLP
ncbi:hypothetical protein [Leucobacter sp. wl10]|uniref:hypothetical protein n=1 Tax=Leucobacter sp. wl10 TaxID=2304677 RepID=UPI000E5A9610|nr:hypothetical protein [Leucobacter sp. wl10]RGE21586.1 hypothetical protein D1J51_07095 [Leucobacter sp. wl10]